jgi:hypothetical protein
MTDQLEAARRSYAEELRFTAHLDSPAVVAAFASVPRERFVGAGPWRVRSPIGPAERRDLSPRPDEFGQDRGVIAGATAEMQHQFTGGNVEMVEQERP